MYNRCKHMFSKAEREREKNVSLIRLISAHDTALISVIMGYWATENCCQGVGRALFVSLSCFFVAVAADRLQYHE